MGKKLPQKWGYLFILVKSVTLTERVMLELPHLRVSTRVGWNSVFQNGGFLRRSGHDHIIAIIFIINVCLNIVLHFY